MPHFREKKCIFGSVCEEILSFPFLVSSPHPSRSLCSPQLASALSGSSSRARLGTTEDWTSCSTALHLSNALFLRLNAQEQLALLGMLHFP